MKKDQFIVVCADTQATAQALLPTAETLGRQLRKEIIVLSCSADAEQWIGNLGHLFVALKCDWPTAVAALPVKFNAVLALALADPKAPRRSPSHPKTLLKNFSECKIAYLVIPTPLSPHSNPLSPLTVALTVDHNRESKEKLVWASYFARFCDSRILVLHHPYRDPLLRSRWQNNMRYLEKMYSSLGIAYEPRPMENSRQLANPDLTAIGEPGIDLFIALAADLRDRDLLDLLTPRPEPRLIRNTRHLPVLLLNQRDDLYILCD